MYEYINICVYIHDRLEVRGLWTREPALVLCLTLYIYDVPDISPSLSSFSVILISLYIHGLSESSVDKLLLLNKFLFTTTQR